MTAIIVAYDDNRVIGFKNEIPWHLPEDLKLFKERTTGHPIIMGRNTWDSLPKRPLPKRYNIVITRQEPSAMIEQYGLEDNDDVDFVDSLPKAIRLANKRMPTREAFVIGGTQIYLMALESGFVDKVIVTKVPGEHEGDAHFPALNDNWVCQWIDDEHEGFSIFEYVRKNR